MRPPRPLVTTVTTLASVAALTLAAAPRAHAQLGSGTGFLFRNPTLRLGVAGGYASPSARSDIYDFLTTELSLERRDFASPSFTLSAAVRVAPRVEVGLSAMFADRTKGSDSRDFTGEDDLPILQTTTLKRRSIMATGRLSLLEPGRAIGRYAWIPNRVVPFIGAGAGAVRYRLYQEGEFVDRETLDIFADEFESTGWGFGATGFAGADFSLSPRFGLTAEARYLWSRAPMNGDFSTFSKIDLSGYDASIGLFVRF